ncbi:GNAT family N-acetyltransferase [Krasilnikovia sp. MM14-A1004]|uniref:GNAT family N-acetyltransferase n=1 Tax=Krasilnikovia sp. MM14-A1004 TaxID=3373541 RepID=UPI00399C7624
MMVLRPLAERDWSDVAALEARTYAPAGLSEDPAHLASRTDPATSFVLATDDGVAGYLLALPYPRGRCPDPTSPERTTFVSANLHLHDLVVGRSHRHQGLGGRLVRHLIGRARRMSYRTVSLVAVGDSADFWAAQGFRAQSGITVPAAYGPRAGYLSLSL